jgi:hypothetical protein
MVKNSGTSSRPRHLRALNEPRPVTVLTEHDLPVAILRENSRDAARHAVETVQDTWIVQDEWWRQEIDRQYYNLLLRNGTVCTVYHDRLTDTWYEQAY